MIRAALPLLLMTVLWGLGIWTAWNLYNHSSTNSEMRKPPAVVDQSGTVTALGGGDQPAPAACFFEKFFITTVSPDLTAHDPAGAVRAATLQTYIYNCCFYCCVFELLRVALKFFILKNEDFWTAGIELFVVFCPFFLGYIGAKHRDSQVLWSYLASGGFCFLAFIPQVTYLVLLNMAGKMGPDQEEACKADPECDPATAEVELNHPLDSLPLLFLQILFGVGVWYGWQLLQHPSVDAGAKPPAGTAAAAAGDVEAAGSSDDAKREALEKRLAHVRNQLPADETVAQTP